MDFARAPGESQADLIAASKATLTATITIGSNSDSWQEADAAARKEIQNAEPGILRSNLEQALSKLLLTGYLIPNAKSEGASEAALYYSNLLVKRGSPETETVLKAVQEFGDVWSDQELHAVAIGAATVAERYATMDGPCVDCKMPIEATEDLEASGNSDGIVHARRLAAASQLRQLAE